MRNKPKIERIQLLVARDHLFIDDNDVSHQVTRFFYLFIFVGLSVIFVVHFVIAGQAVYGDGVGYYAHLRTWIIDKDWETTNEYEHVYTPENNDSLSPQKSKEVQIVGLTPIGKAANKYTPGPGILLLPAYFVSHLLVATGRFFGFPLSNSGYGWIYQIASGLAAIGYLALGLALLEKLLIKVVQNETLRKLTILGILVGTPLIYYGGYDVINSHFASFFLASLFFYVFLTRKQTWQMDAFLGGIAGLLATTRPQDGVVVIVWIVATSIQTYTKIQPTSVQQWLITIKILLTRIGTFILPFAILLLPLLYHWQNTFGNILGVGYMYEMQRGVTQTIDLFGSLFHKNNGIITRAPILLPALIYYFYLCIKRKCIIVWQLALFALLEYCIITIQAGWIAAAYGGRMYMSSLVFFAVPLALLFQAIFKKFNIQGVIVIIVASGIFTAFSIGKFILFEKEAEGGRRGTEMRTIERMIEVLGITKRQVQ